MGEAIRQRLPFRRVNRRDEPDYDPSLQRHHLIPRQIADRTCFGAMLDRIDRRSVGIDDFRSNGLLLPCCETSAVRMGLPLHRGPHRTYNSLVIERVGQIEADWSCKQLAEPESAAITARMRLSLLQGALRRLLLGMGRLRPFLSRRDPARASLDFSEIDGVADVLWGATEIAPAWVAAAYEPVRADSETIAS